MKNRRLSLHRAALGLAVPGFVSLLALQAGCASAPKMRSGAGVPASQGTVETSTGDNGNTELTIRVKHLAPPSKVASDATVYIVWIQPKNGTKQSVGALQLDKDLEGVLETVTPQRHFDVIVTPEPSAQVSQPTHDPVFTASVDHQG